MKSFGAIPFGEYAPDIPAIAGAHLEVANNTLPRASGYEPLNSLDRFTTVPIPGAERAVGGESFTDFAGVSYNLVATPTRIYRTSGTGWEDVSKGGLPYTSTNRWEFVSWENRALIASADNQIQQWDFDSPQCTDLVYTPLQAKTIAVIKNQVMVGNVTDSDGLIPNRVRWSAVNNPDDFTPSTLTLSGFTQLESTSGGTVLRIIGGEFGIIFMNRAIWRASFTGDPNEAYQFDEVEYGIRCLSGSAVVPHDGAAWYLSEDGFRVTRGAQSQGIGEERTDRTVLSDLDSAYLDRITCSVLADEQTLVWAYPGSASLEGVPNKLVMYNHAANRWATGDEAVHLLWRSRQPNRPLDGGAGSLDELYPFTGLPTGGVDSVPGSLDSSLWSGGALDSAVIDADGHLAYFKGPPKDAVFETSEFQHSAGRKTMVTNVLPLVDSASSVELEVGARNAQSERVTYTYFGVPMSTGYITARSNARYHRYRLTVRSPWESASGLEVFGNASERR